MGIRLEILSNFSHEWELEWKSPWFLDQLLISDCFSCVFDYKK
jgi:hypothetical protein